MIGRRPAEADHPITHRKPNFRKMAKIVFTHERKCVRVRKTKKTQFPNGVCCCLFLRAFSKLSLYRRTFSSFVNNLTVAFNTSQYQLWIVVSHYAITAIILFFSFLISICCTSILNYCWNFCAFFVFLYKSWFLFSLGNFSSKNLLVFVSNLKCLNFCETFYWKRKFPFTNFTTLSFWISPQCVDPSAVRPLLCILIRFFTVVYVW